MASGSAHRGWITGVCCALLLAVPPAASAQNDAPSPLLETERSRGFSIFGHAPAHRVAGGSMVLTVHPFIDTSKYPLVADHFDGFYVRYSQFFVAGFTNSYHDQSWVAAIERHWGSKSIWLFDVGLGYRAGIVTGYDERLMELARHTPVLPLGGILVWAHLGPVGTNVFWAYRAISVDATLRCC